MTSLDRDAAISRAKTAVARASADYQKPLKRTIAEFEAALVADDSKTALRVAQNLAGEAGGFGWPAVSALASALRDILETPASEKRKQALSHGADALNRLVAENERELTDNVKQLVAQLTLVKDVLGSRT